VPRLTYSILAEGDLGGQAAPQPIQLVEGRRRDAALEEREALGMNLGAAAEFNP
jgi:hypothetical protein